MLNSKELGIIKLLRKKEALHAEVASLLTATRLWCLKTEPAAVSAGVFAIQGDKKSPAVTKTAKHVGMIAGGTGELEKLTSAPYLLQRLYYAVTIGNIE